VPSSGPLFVCIYRLGYLFRFPTIASTPPFSAPSVLRVPAFSIMSDSSTRPELVIAIDFGMTCMTLSIILLMYFLVNPLHRYRRRILQRGNWRGDSAMASKMARKSECS
jgi:hypothetical protein